MTKYTKPQIKVNIEKTVTNPKISRADGRWCC